MTFHSDRDDLHKIINFCEAEIEMFEDLDAGALSFQDYDILKGQQKMARAVLNITTGGCWERLEFGAKLSEHKEQGKDSFVNGDDTVRGES